MEGVLGCGIMATVNEGEFSVRVGSSAFAQNGADKRRVFTEGEIRKMKRWNGKMG